MNFSVCYYEILKNPSKACTLAKEAFDEAIQKLDSLDDASYKVRPRDMFLRNVVEGGYRSCCA